MPMPPMVWTPGDTPDGEEGFLALVTGANGYLGAHICDQFIQCGYRVRGTVRDLEKSAWLVDYFEEKYEPDRFQLVQVADMAVEGAYDEVVKGVHIFIHTASVVSLDPDPNKTVPLVISGALNGIKAAYKARSVVRFIYTSSTAALYSPLDIPDGVVTEDTWNEAAIKEAWKEPPYEPERGMIVYAAAKTQAEKEIWRYHKEHRKDRSLIVNTILPGVVLGSPLDPANQGYPSTSNFIPLLFKGQTFPMKPFFPPQYFIHVKDVALLHRVAIVWPDVHDERIFAASGRFSWDKVLAILRKAKPDAVLPDDFCGGEDPHEIKDTGRAKNLFNTVGLKERTSLEEAVLDNIKDL